VDVLWFVVVLAEVARGVEELLGDDRRAQPRVDESDRLAGRLDIAAALEVLAHRRDVENLDRGVGHPADLAVVEGDELHDGQENTMDITVCKLTRRQHLPGRM